MKIVKYADTFPFKHCKFRYVRNVIVDHGKLVILSSSDEEDAMLFEDHFASLLVKYMEDNGYLMPDAEVPSFE